MRIKDYRQMIDYLCRPGYQSGGQVSQLVQPGAGRQGYSGTKKGFEGPKKGFRNGFPGYRVVLRRKTADGVAELDRFFSTNRHGDLTKAKEAAQTAYDDFITDNPIDTSLHDMYTQTGKSKYKVKELNKAVQHYTDGKYKTWDELTKIASEVKQTEMKNAPLEVREAYHTRIGIRNNLQANKGKFVIPDPTGGQFKPIYFTEYSDKDFIKDLKARKSPYEIATDYYLKNKKMVQKQMIGNVEYTRPISYLAKVLTQRRKRDMDVAEELINFQDWSKKQKAPKTQREYTLRVEKLLPLAHENGIVPKSINTASGYFKWAKKQKIDPLLKLFNHMEKIGVEHIAGISRAVDIMDYKSLGEIVPLLGGKDVNFEKGLLYDRPMTGLAKNILKSDSPTIQNNNLKALNNMSKEAAEMYNTIAVKYKLSSTDKNPIGGKMLERITKGDPLSNTLLRDADLLMKQYVASGGEKRESFKHLDPDVKKTIKLYQSGDVKGGIQLLKKMGYGKHCKASGGRVGFAEAGAVTGEMKCIMGDVEKTRADMKSSNVEVRAKALTKQRKALQLASKLPGIGKILKTGIQMGTAAITKPLKALGLTAPIGYAIEGIVEGGFYDNARRKGYSHKQAMAETFTPGLIAGRPHDVPWHGGSEKLREKELYGVREAPKILDDGTIVPGDLIPGKVQPKVKQYVDALKEQDRIYDVIGRKEELKGEPTTTDETLFIPGDLAGASADVQDLARSGAYRRVDQTLKPESMASQAYETAVEQQLGKDLQRKKEYLEEYDPGALEREEKILSRPRQLEKRYDAMEERFPTYTREQLDEMLKAWGANTPWNLGFESGVKGYEQMAEWLKTHDKYKDMEAGVANRATGGIASLKK